MQNSTMFCVWILIYTAKIQPHAWGGEQQAPYGGDGMGRVYRELQRSWLFWCVCVFFLRKSEINMKICLALMS